MAFWKSRWEDVRGNLLWQVMLWIFGGGLLSAIIEGIRASQHVPFEWKFVAVVFVVSALSIAVITLLAARPRNTVQQPGSQSLSPPSTVQLTTKVLDDLYRGVDSRLTDETEEGLRKTLSQFPPGNDRENFLLRIVIIGWILYDFEIIWYNIFASQIEALQELNTGALKRENLFKHYIQAATTYLHWYSAYSFEQWIGYMRTQVLIREDGDQINITVKGRSFLKHLIDTGRSASGRTL